MLPIRNLAIDTLSAPCRSFPGHVKNAEENFSPASRPSLVLVLELQL